MEQLNLAEDKLLNANFLYEHSPCGHLSFSPDKPILKINQTLLDWIGLTAEEVVHKKRFFDLLSVGGKLYYEMIFLPLLSRQGFVNEINFDIKVKNGQSFPCLFNAVGLKEADGTMAVHAIILKITDRKKYESELLRSKQFAEEERKRFESLSNIIPEIIWTALANGNVNFMNERFFEHFRNADETLRKTTLLHLVHPPYRKELLKLWIKAVQNGEKFEAEVLLKKKSDNYEWFIIRAVPYRNPNNLVEMWFGSCTNIHEHKQQQLKAVENLNNSLYKASEMISSKDRTLEEIAYNQSHLVRRPLANILGLIEMLECGKETSIVNMLKQSASELDDTIKDIIFKV